MKRWVRRGLGASVVAFALLQAVPYGWWHSNPPVGIAAPWPNPESERLARASCYACHSNETDWPAYSYVAPMSWLVRQDVEAGRDAVNFSEWDEYTDADPDAVADGSMPPGRYTLIHTGAKLSEPERRLLVDALESMERDAGGDGAGGDDDSRRE